MFNIRSQTPETLFQEAQQRGIVWTLFDLGVRDGLCEEEDEDLDPHSLPEYKEHGQAIEHVMQMEIAFWVFRRLPGPWGEVVDGMITNRNRFCNNYREKTGYQIDTRQDHLLD